MWQARASCRREAAAPAEGRRCPRKACRGDGIPVNVSAVGQAAPPPVHLSWVVVTRAYSQTARLSDCVLCQAARRSMAPLRRQSKSALVRTALSFTRLFLTANSRISPVNLHACTVVTYNCGRMRSSSRLTTAHLDKDTTVQKSMNCPESLN